MSSFVVSDHTIERILYPLDNKCTLHGECRMRREREKVAAFFGTTPGDPELSQTLALAMLELNCNATGQRYGTEETAEPFRVSCRRTSLIQSYKSLRCWLYQCSEGDVPESSGLYKLMESISGDRAEEIVSSLPEYDKAAWD
jgi:hypothetical protein